MFSLTKFSETLLAFASGALMTLVGTFIQAEFKEAREAETWFQTNYVTNGIDPVQNYVTLLGIYLVERNVPLNPTDEFPKHALVNLSAVLGSPVATQAIVFVLNNANGLGNDEVSMRARHNLSCVMGHISRELHGLRVGMLAHDFDQKSQIATLPDQSFSRSFVANIDTEMKNMGSCQNAS
jgi:hypothetical protein